MYFNVFQSEIADAYREFYYKRPHLYAKHEKKFLDEYDSPYTWEANNFVPEDLDEWFKNLPKLYQYESWGYVKLDRHNHLIILSIYSISDKPYLTRRAIYDTETDEGYYFVIKRIGTAPYAMLHCDGKYQMGGWTDYDQFYSSRQRHLDAKSYEILKSVPMLKHLPIEKLKFINAYTLLDTDDVEWVYQMEILIKMGLVNLATDLHIGCRKIDKKYFTMFKKDIMRGIRYDALSLKIAQYENDQREKEKAKKRHELIKLYAKLPKSVFDIGDYIIKHPESAKELEHEGNILHHCVSSYLPRIVKGDSEILVLRKKSAPDEPFFTIEIVDGKVSQVRTERNKTDESITHLVKQWQEQRIGA